MSTTADQARFIEALLTGSLLDAASLATMKEGVDTGYMSIYGLGLESAVGPSGNMYFHGGLVNGTETVVLGIPSRGIYVVVIANTFPGRVFDIADALIARVVSPG